MAQKERVQALVIGANGLVGRRIGSDLSNLGIRWQGTCNKRPDGALVCMDITDAKDLDLVFSNISPGIVFNMANLAGGVDFCEKNPEAGRDFHVNATRAIGERCRDEGALMVFVSTDYIFDGTKGPYKEGDEPNPLNLYGRLKLEAEEWIKKNLRKYVIIRTTNVYGWDPETVTPNYMMGMYRSLSGKRPFNAPSFLWGNPTYVGDLAEASIELASKGANGVYHVVGSSFIDRFTWAGKACEALRLDASLLREVKDPPQGIVPRPLKSWLDTGKFTSSFKTILHDVDDGLRLMKANMEDSKAKA